MDVEKPKAYDIMQQLGVVKLRGDKNNLEENVVECNLYPRPKYNGGICTPKPSYSL